MADTLAPHTSAPSPYSPLEELIAAAIRRYGDFSTRRVTPDVVLMMIDGANEIVELVNGHPYWEGVQLDYYIAQSERRPIPDLIMVRGLLAWFAEQQASDKFPNAWQAYNKWLNQVLYTRKYGGSVRHELLPLENSSPNLDAEGNLLQTELTTDT